MKTHPADRQRRDRERHDGQRGPYVSMARPVAHPRREAPEGRPAGPAGPAGPAVVERAER
jgi:hypothetical protein